MRIFIVCWKKKITLLSWDVLFLTKKCDYESLDYYWRDSIKHVGYPEREENILCGQRSSRGQYRKYLQPQGRRKRNATTSIVDSDILMNRCVANEDLQILNEEAIDGWKKFNFNGVQYMNFNGNFLYIGNIKDQGGRKFVLIILFKRSNART